MELPSTKPYLIRAIQEWCCDNCFTPHIAVLVDKHVRVPFEFVRDGQIVLNIGYGATGHLTISNEGITFQARFGGVARDIAVPIANVTSIYARENGAGMDFEAELGAADKMADSGDAKVSDDEPLPPMQAPAGRPKLQRIK